VRSWDDVKNILTTSLPNCEASPTTTPSPPRRRRRTHVTHAGVEAVGPDTLVVVCDAHLDLRDAYDGNPLSHACVTRRALDDLGVDRAVIVGARTGSEAEWDRAADADVTVVPPKMPGSGSTASTRTRLKRSRVCCSVDIDGLDPGFAPGTGTMEPFGLAPREARDLVRAVAPAADGFDVVEVNDRDDGQAAALAGKLLREFVQSHAAAQGE